MKQKRKTEGGGAAERQEDKKMEWKRRTERNRFWGKGKSFRGAHVGVTHAGLLKAQGPWGTFSLGLEAGRFAGQGRTIASRMCVDKNRQEAQGCLRRARGGGGRQESLRKAMRGTSVGGSLGTGCKVSQGSEDQSQLGVVE